MSKKKIKTLDSSTETVGARNERAEMGEMPENGAGPATAAAKGVAAPKASATPNFGDLEKVRQILFGEESQEIHQRLMQLEERFSNAIDALRDAVEKRFDAMAASVQKQHEALNTRLVEEMKQQAGANAGLGKDVEAVAQALRDNRAQLDDHIAATERALRDALKDEADKASKDRTAGFKELTARLEQAVAALQTAKTDRHGLADLLDDLAGRLRKP